jgi:hypothetical protein
MKLKDFFALAVAFFVATLFVLVLQPFLFYQPVIPFSMTTNDLEDWLGAVFWPTTLIVYGLGIFFLFIWILKAAKSKFTNAKRALSNQGLWWLLLIINVILGLIAFFAVSFFSGWLDGEKSIEPLFWVPPFIILDAIFIYWLPTAIATPRSLRYVPPLAMTLRKLYGG